MGNSLISVLCAFSEARRDWRRLALVKLSSALLAFVLAAAAVPCANAQPRVHPLYLEDEHRGDYTFATARDSEGFLWVGSEGLKRYDGYNFRIFTPDPADPNSVGSTVSRVFLRHSNGSFWAGGTRLSLYHPKTESFTVFDVSKSGMIRALFEDHDGSVWIGGEGFGLLRFDPARQKVTQRLFEGSNQGWVYSIDRQGDTENLWLATDAGLLLFNTQTSKVTSYQLPLEFFAGSEAITGMVEDDQGQVWLTSHSGLYVLNPKTGAVRHYQADVDVQGSLSTNLLWAVMKDSKGQIWVGTDKKGVHKYLPEADSFLHFAASANDRYRFPLASVTHIYEDEEGTLWFSLGHHGVYRMSAHLQKFQTFQNSWDSDNSLSLNNVLSLHEDRAGFIWVGTDGGGLNRLDPRTQSFVHYRHDPRDSQSLSNDAILDIAEDSKGYLWIGTWSGGLNRLDPRTGKFKRYLRDPTATAGQTLAENHVFRIVVDERDRLVMAVGRSGLQIFDPSTGSFESYSLNDVGNPSGIRSDMINDILPTPDGSYWVGGYRGIELFTPATGRFTAPALSTTHAISDLHLDDAGLLWIATDKNLTRYDPATGDLAHFAVEQGLSDESIISIEEDDAGYLWLGTRKGLNRFDPKTGAVTHFDERDGLAGPQFNRAAHHKTRAGRMYFGGTNGLSAFNPLNMPRNERAPEVHITGLEINHEPQQPGQSPWLTQVVDHTDELVLPSSANNITFKLASSNLIAPLKNQYRYRLAGQQEDWLTVDSSRRVVQYSNLDPGHYQFQVLAANNEGVWASEPKVVRLTVLPAWWQTWWMRSVYLALLLAFIYAFSYWRLRLNRNRQQQLEILVDEQTSQLKEANRSILHLNADLEDRVAQRTRDLLNEIEERRESEAQTRYIAYHDALTGLYNRAWLLKHLQQRIESATSGGPRFALLFIGGDRFRKVNDTYGHLQGDKLLQAAAKRLQGVIDESCHATRLGSDEFTVVADRVESDAQAEELAERVTEAFREPFVIDQVRLGLGVSVGFVIGDASYSEPSQLLRNANIAMQRAKDRGRGVCQMFDSVILQQTLDMAALEADLKVALVREQFSVVYQPIVVVGSGALNGFEVLIRWRHPERGMVPPDKFISIAESLGLIFDIGLWVLEKACLQLNAWQKELNPQRLPTIAVNLSPVQLDRPDFLDRVDEVLRRTGASPSNIKFEITESALMKHTGTVDGLLESLRERGIELAIDDFGTGYSSLSYLDKLPVQVLKIDRSFINALTDLGQGNGSAQEIVRATISLAHNLGMRVVAEGIETAEQLGTLREFGCDFAQGYFFARPMSPEDASSYLEKSLVE